MNAFAVMPCTWSASRVVITVTPVANMPERAPQRDPRVVAEPGRQLDVLRRRDVVEAAVADPVGPRPDRRAAEREVELRWRLVGPGMDWTNCYTTWCEGPAAVREHALMAGPSRRRSAPGGARVRISNPDKLLFPADGITKAELAAYYAAVAPAMVPHVRDRPLNLWRWNAGIDKATSSSSRRSRRARPDWVRRVEVRAAARRDGRRTRSAARPRRSSGSPTRTASPRTRGRAAPTGSASPTGSCSTSTRPTRTPDAHFPAIRAGALRARRACCASSGSRRTR